MAQSKKQCVVAVMLCGFLMLIGAEGTAQDVRFSPEEIRIEQHSSMISWQPKVAYESAVLTVSGPEGFNRRIEFAAGDAIELRLGDKKLGEFEDGQYTWELRMAPVVQPDVRSALQAAREADDAAGVEGLKRGSRTPSEMAAVSGYFRVAGGGILASDRVEVPADDRGAPAGDSAVATKTTISGDLSVYNSLCVGFDCAAAESYGSDTIRLKENTLRIHFDDTSTGSFPANDWRLVANESSSGGADYFVIEDSTAGRNVFVVEAGARSNSLYVESDGDVGFGTANPVVNLHVVDGNTPTLRLEQDGSSGFTPQTWDVAGNEAGFFVRDVTGGSTLPFRILPSASSSTLVISGDDNVGIGAGTSPTDKLHVVNGDLRVERTTSGTTDHAAIYVEQSGAAITSTFMIRANASTGSLEIKDAVAAATALKFRSGAANNSIVVAPGVGGSPRVGIGDTTPSGTLDVAGTIFLSGAQIHPDFVFEPGFEIDSIDEHAAYMWSQKHLPAVGPGEYDENGMARFELGKQQVGLLEELEVAHVYIDQLHSRLQDQESAIAALEDRLAALEKASPQP